MTKRVFEGIKRFQTQRWMGTHSRGRRRPDLVQAMNATPAEFISPSALKALNLKKRRPKRKAKPTSEKQILEKVEAVSTARKGKMRIASKTLSQPKNKKSKRARKTSKNRDGVASAARSRRSLIFSKGMCVLHRLGGTGHIVSSSPEGTLVRFTNGKEQLLTPAMTLDLRPYP